MLSRVEHNRWMANRILAGWTYGENKDPNLKTHPDIKDFKLLDEKIKDLDRNTVKMIPEYLKRLNLENVMMNES